jgi:ribosomal protein L11 methyltransferase
MSYTQLQVTCDPVASELLIAELSMEGYDVFEEIETGFITSIESNKYDASLTENLFTRYSQQFPLEWKASEVERINWNKEWEKNYEPVQVEDKIYVRATFHEPNPSFAHEIVIHPKMSFGTGHHATTSLMLREQLNIDHKGKFVYDFGTGTGILAIMAGLLNASTIIANDVDDWCIDNSRDNLALNNIEAELLLGPVSSLRLSQKADIVLANINKNILLNEFEDYARLLKKDGYLLMSGFYESDIPDLMAKASALNLEKVRSATKNEWAVLVLRYVS